MKPIVFGNVARYFGKKREDDGHTHQWTVYVKPYRNEVYIYVFLHSSIALHVLYYNNICLSLLIFLGHVCLCQKNTVQTT